MYRWAWTNYPWAYSRAFGLAVAGVGINISGFLLPPSYMASGNFAVHFLWL